MTSHEDSITELFARMPDEWDEKRLAKMTEEYRKYRANLESLPNKAARAAATPKVPKEDLKGISGKDLLGKLGLGVKL